MTYTLSTGLRDREYAKFTPEQIGSITGVNVSNVLKTYDFGLQTSSAQGLFSSYTTSELNGILKGIYIKSNTFAATGSLFITISGYGQDILYVHSGIDLPNYLRVDQSGGFIPKAFARTNYGDSLSGTNATGVWEDIPMYGKYILTGSGMGNGTSGLGVILVYQ